MAAIAAAGLALRLVHLFAFHHDPLGGDGAGYWVMAQQVGDDGRWFTNPITGAPDANHPPLWSLLLGTFALLGAHDLVTFQVLASLIGVASIVAVAALGRRIGGDRVGLVAAATAAAYPGFWLYERIMLSETLLLLVVAVLLLAIYRFIDRPTTWGVVGLGALGGLAALTRSEQILVAAVLILPVVLGRRSVDLGRRLLWVGLAGVTMAALVASWTVYNLGRFDSPVLLSNQSATVLNIGNCDGAYDGPKLGWFDLDCAYRAAMAEPDLAKRDERARADAIAYATGHADRLPVVVAARLGRTFGVYAPFQQIDLEWELQHTGSLVPRIGLVGYWLLIPAAVAGVVSLRRRGIAVYPLLGVVAIVAVTTMVTLGESRYRAAAEVPIVVLGALGIDAALRWVHGRRARPEDEPATPIIETSIAFPNAAR